MVREVVAVVSRPGVSGRRTGARGQLEHFEYVDPAAGDSKSSRRASLCEPILVCVRTTGPGPGVLDAE